MLQPVVFKCTIEAEYMVIAEVYKESVWFTGLYAELCDNKVPYTLLTVGHGQPGPTQSENPVLGRVGLACRAGFRPGFGARTSDWAGLGLAENVI
jgi:hypothetical protein